MAGWSGDACGDHQRSVTSPAAAARRIRPGARPATPTAPMPCKTARRDTPAPARSISDLEIFDIDTHSPVFLDWLAINSLCVHVFAYLNSNFGCLTRRGAHGFC